MRRLALIRAIALAERYVAQVPDFADAHPGYGI
jgi:hypothetical protein